MPPTILTPTEIEHPLYEGPMEFTPAQGPALAGSKFGYLIVKKPHNAEAVRLALDITTDVVTRHGLLRARVTERDRTHLSRVVCTD